MTKTHRDTQEGWEVDFDLMWGVAPEGTAKHEKGKEVKAFIQQTLTQQAKEIFKEVENIFIDPNVVAPIDGFPFRDDYINSNRAQTQLQKLKERYTVKEEI